MAGIGVAPVGEAIDIGGTEATMGAGCAAVPLCVVVGAVVAGATQTAYKSS